MSLSTAGRGVGLFALSLSMFAGQGCSAGNEFLGGRGAEREKASIPIFPGGGVGAAPLAPGVGPETAGDCTAPSNQLPGEPPPDQAEVEATCYYGEEDPDVPAAIVERVLETVDDIDVVHIRLTLSPLFVDNSYGETAVGWEDSKKGGHKFKELVGSDHAEIMMTDGAGETVLHFKADYLSEDPTAPSGYATQGVSGGKNDGEMLLGDEAHILAVATSLDRNLNGCGYGMFTEDSPMTDEVLSPSLEAPNWDYRMVYEIWIDAEAFGSAGFGSAFVEYVHASPSKTGENTVVVEEGPCPPEECLVGPDLYCDGWRDDPCLQPEPDPALCPQPEVPEEPEEDEECNPDKEVCDVVAI